MNKEPDRHPGPPRLLFASLNSFLELSISLSISKLSINHRAPYSTKGRGLPGLVHQELIRMD